MYKAGGDPDAERICLWEFKSDCLLTIGPNEQRRAKSIFSIRVGKRKSSFTQYRPGSS